MAAGKREREVELALTEQVMVQVIWRKRRTMTLRVEPDGRVRILVPWHARSQDVLRFAKGHLSWILRHREEVLARQRARCRLVSLSGGVLPVLGELTSYRVEVLPGHKDEVRAEVGGLCVTLGAAQEQQLREALETHLKAVAKETIARRIGVYQPYFTCAPRSWRVGSAKTRWGSCSGQNRLNFCWRIAMAPLPVLDYLVVHEMSHMEHHDHSPAFWAKVAQILPDYAQRRRILREQGSMWGLN
ncbi:M48 family metallopeptidase [Luoshenia tenuis]|uniref:M48 family metallopeptidase n=1 Tax=Luoshenia tenuis TaxID=2763654 RepID=UPI003D914997